MLIFGVDFWSGFQRRCNSITNYSATFVRSAWVERECSAERRADRKKHRRSICELTSLTCDYMRFQLHDCKPEIETQGGGGYLRRCSFMNSIYSFAVCVLLLSVAWERRGFLQGRTRRSLALLQPGRLYKRGIWRQIPLHSFSCSSPM